jgi:hypothetical protein
MLSVREGEFQNMVELCLWVLASMRARQPARTPIHSLPGANDNEEMPAAQGGMCIG